MDERPEDPNHIWLTSVGVDIGTSTSHVTISRLHLQRLSESLSSRFVTVEREIIKQSPITFTPYIVGDRIDARALADLVRGTYESAGLTKEQVDTGAVILTGEAVKRVNARDINDQLASLAGSFVSTTAGPRLEAVIAAHGSGSVELSRSTPGARVLNIDIGGGTTKFALMEDGRIVATAAMAVGGRLIAADLADHTRVGRLEAAGDQIAKCLGIELSLGGPLRNTDRIAVGEAMARAVLAVVQGETETRPLLVEWITPPLDLVEPPDRILFSGGVAQYVLERELQDFGDLGPAFGAALRQQIDAIGFVAVEPKETIRATVVGASQYTVQLSGNTVDVSGVDTLPMRNLRVIAPELSLPIEVKDVPRIAERIAEAIEAHGDSGNPYALAIRWQGTPFYDRLRGLCEGILAAVGDPKLVLVLLFDTDIARSIGHILRDEVGWVGPLVALDGLAVGEFDYVDIGSRIDPAGSYPVVVKTLIYP